MFFSSQEPRIAVGTVNFHVAERALPIFRIEQIMRRRKAEHAGILSAEGPRAVVAFEANSENNRALQQFRVRGAM